LFTEDEPTAPRVSTAIPGPKGQQALEELDRIFDARSVNFVADYRRSMGN
jgi:4-aminobutyrate aminotransferase/(S)-3-amino-2-methylpropionate transaminase